MKTKILKIQISKKTVKNSSKTASILHHRLTKRRTVGTQK
jgi:hypothetical protein